MKKYLTLVLVTVSAVALSGCSLSGSRGNIGPFAKTTDGGKAWETRVKIDDKQNISKVNVLSLAIDPSDTRRMYLGTDAAGMYFSGNGGDTWEKTSLGVQKIHSIVIDYKNNQSIYVGGLWNGRGKIFHSENGGKDWIEAYSEPSNGTSVTSLAMSRDNSSMLYAGTSEGMIIKTTDGGKSWSNLYKVKGTISDIVFDMFSDNTIYFVILNAGLFRTNDEGKTFEDLTGKIKEARFNTNINTIIADTASRGVIYLGVNGAILRSKNFGDTWESLNILETSKKFPIRSLAINPKNSQEIIYAGGQALYKSFDGGSHWSTYQLDTTLTVQLLKYDSYDPLTIYMGMIAVKK